MDAVGWTRLAPKNQEETSPWAVLTESSGKHLKVYVTDLASLWCEEQNASQIVARCEELNELIESTAENLIQHLCLLLRKGEEVQVEPNGPEALSLKLDSKLGTLRFVWIFHMAKLSAVEFSNQIIRPLLAIIREASSVEEELCAIIRAKDKQIDEYKASGATVSRRLETTEFKKDRFFANRRVRTLNDSIKTDPVSLFCQVSNDGGSWGLYSQAVSLLQQAKQTEAEKELAKTEPTTADGASNQDVTQHPASPLRSEKPTVSLSTPSKKETEATRQEALRKRLQEEALKRDAKRSKKSKNIL